MKRKARLLNANTQQVLIETLDIANTPWTRFRGLMFRRNTLPSYGMLIRPCRSIHTMWMRMTIDIYFLSDDNLVVGSRYNVRPWRIVFAPRGTANVLETPAGQTHLPLDIKLMIDANEGTSTNDVAKH